MKKKMKKRKKTKPEKPSQANSKSVKTEARQSTRYQMFTLRESTG
jgi:hypothetical protein